MPPLSRRDFLRVASTWASALILGEVLSACSEQTPALPAAEDPTQLPTTSPAPDRATQLPTISQPSATPQVESITQTPPPEPTAAQPSWTATPQPSPDLVVVRNGEPEELVRRALAALGGMEKFVPPGADVIVKPNICVGYLSYEYAATTNPWVVGTLVKLCYAAGARRVRVMDHTWRREMAEGYVTSGIQAEVEGAGGEMVIMPLEKFIPTEIPLGLDLKMMDLYDDILNAEVLINVPIAKHHQDARLTLGMKNLMGVMQNRPIIHDNIGQRLADLNSRVRPTLNILDAVRMMTAHGPISGYLGDVKQIDTLIASTDVVALDSYGATLFDMQPEDLDYVVAATAMGLGRSDLHNLRIEEINLNA